MAIKKEKTIEERYQHLDEITHILKRPGMFIGSTKYEPKSFFLYNDEDEKLELREIEYVPALLKLCDEVISNSCDEFRRSSNLGLTEIIVTIDNSGTFKVRDNGGIPVVKHKTANMMLPDFLFGQLRTSSNYDDSETRNVVGTNGLGQKLSAIFSKTFYIFTSDSKKSFYHSWSDNMRTVNDDTKIKSCKDHFTESYYEFDLNRFEDINELSDDFIDLIEKRCIDAAAANPGLTVKFIHNSNNEPVKESIWKFDTFDDYIRLYENYVDCNTCIHTEDKQKSIWFFPDGNINIGFVNGAECSSGTHIKAIHNAINDTVAEYISSKKKVDGMQGKYVEGKYSTFCIFQVHNPMYSSQTKETLTTPVNKFDATVDNYQFSISKKFLDEVCKSDLVETVVDWYKQKQEVEDQKTLRKLNKESKKKISSDKYIPANAKNPADRDLIIMEGLSAGAGGRVCKLPSQAIYLMRGVTLNSIDASPTKVMSNRELSDLVNIIGLQWGKKNAKEDLNFNRIIIATDADEDGTKIAGILLVFFNKFPELFEYQMVARLISPLIIATKGDETIKFYSFNEYEEKKDKLNGYQIKYAKGLGSLNNEQYKDMLRNPILHIYRKDELTDAALHRWFGKGIAKERREVLKTEV